VVIYGPGGIGKSSLCKSLEEVGSVPLFIDIEGGTHELDIARICATTLEGVRDILHGPQVDEFGAVVIDTGTKLEELCSDFVIRTVPHEKGTQYKIIKSIEDYGFGKGLTHIYEAFMLVLSDLDALARRGKQACIICHECIATAQNPGGEDWLRYEPRLQSPASGKYSIRHRVKEWTDHLLFIGYDVAVKDGRGVGSGTRCIYPNERPDCWAKSRTLDEPIPYEKDDAEVWRRIFNQ